MTLNMICMQGSLLMAFLHRPIYLSTLVVVSPPGLGQGSDVKLDDVTGSQAKHCAQCVTGLETCQTSLAAAVYRAVASELRI